MRGGRSTICALVLAAVLMPGTFEILESAVHLLSEGHLPHVSAHDDRHPPTGPEHGCTPILHVCGCHASLAFIGPKSPPDLGLRVRLLTSPPAPPARPPGYWPTIEHPPRA